jgi:hypothetical protein
MVVELTILKPGEVVEGRGKRSGGLCRESEAFHKVEYIEF